jgi:Cys-tRNA(Pro)/Cys-tRNA(Cys) deacylase
MAEPRDKKTNACRELERLGIPYALRSYVVDESDLSAESVARKVGMDPASVFKTLCVRGDDRRPLFAVIPGDHELDLKALARAAGNKSAAPVPLKELTALTGYIRGGVTVLAAKKAFPVYLDESALLHAEIAVSAGMRGLQAVLAPSDYARATGAALCAIAVPKPR